MNMYVFAYGSLMNPRSRAKSLPGEHATRSITLKGYRRKMNAPFDGYAYLNIIPSDTHTVEGVLIPVSEHELLLLTEREKGYEKTEVSAQLSEPVDGDVYAFTMPDSECTLKVPRSYIMTCTSGMSENGRQQWLSETILYGIQEDLTAPVYENVAL